MTHRKPAPSTTAPVAAPAWHAMTAAQVLAHCAASRSQGLAPDVVARLLAEHGPNALPQTPPKPWWRSFVRQFMSPLIYILFVAALLAVVMGHLADAAVILAVVSVNAVLGSYQEGRAERSMADLRRLAGVRVRVLRGGHEQVIEARELVPGDLMLLAAGDAVAADARLVEQAQLQVAEAALTGESLPVAKAVPALPEGAALGDRVNMVYSGTHVTAGRAHAVVVATGVHTEVGHIAGLTQNAEEPKTPLEQRLDQFGRALVVAALGLFVLVVLLGLWRHLPLDEVLMVAISQMVSMVPEGLPVAMTIALAVGMQRMAARGAIIRRLSAVETLGSVTVICTDKTGTLTRNEMTVVSLWLPGGRDITVTGVGYAPEGALHEGGRVLPDMDPALAELLRAAVLCNDADLQAPNQDHAAWTVLGDPTEGAMLVLAQKAGVDVVALREQAPRGAELPFDADTKLMATRHAVAGAPRQVLVKGAPESVLRLCSGMGTGADTALLQAARASAEAMAGRALRVLALAQVDDDPLQPEAGFAPLAGRARLLGLVGQIDPPRAEVQPAVVACRAAGIRPVMVTGDHKLTGLAIARALGIAQPGDRAVDGTELQAMNDAQLRSALPRIAVFARVQPAQKLRIVQALQAHGEVVAMTGDGVNDAPALACADVGVAMGITGTEVAKSAAKIVVTDDNFATIVGAVQQGRVVYGNIKKLILYLFATSMDEVLVLVGAVLVGLPMPMLAVQILWINIVTEGTLTVNLVMDPPEGDEMRRAPVPRNDRLLDRLVLLRTAVMALTAAAAAFGWLAWRLRQGVPIEQVRTEVFTLVALSQWFNALNCQSSHASALRLGLLRNHWLTGGLLLSVLLQALVLYAPFMNALFHTVPLPAATVLHLLLLASAVLWAEEGRKLWARRQLRRGTGAAHHRPPALPLGES